MRTDREITAGNILRSRGYQMLRQLGQGGDGTVYLVRYGPTDQLRAAKRIRTDVPERRVHELNMLKRLRHPALPEVLDVLEEDGILWLILEYIRGRPLTVVRQEGITARQFFSIASQLADVLRYLHTRATPILHLDIKPTNLLLRQDGELVLIDFGAAIFTGTEREAASCYGTPGFCAPEQSDPGSMLDARADVYGFGAVLYYCLYGAAPGGEIDRGQLRAMRRSGGQLRQTHRRGGQMRSVGGQLRQMLRDGEDLRQMYRGSRQGRVGWKKYADALLVCCLQREREKRFEDMAALCRGVRAAEKRYLHAQNLRRSALAALLLLFTAAFAAGHLGLDSDSRSAGFRTEYESLLTQAQSLGFTEAAACYQRASVLYPADDAWIAQMLDRIEADYLFSGQEEKTLKELIFAVPPGEDRTVAELQEEYASERGQVDYRIGILYWYYYEGTGGKSAAARWFERAVAAQEETGNRPETEGGGDAESTGGPGRAGKPGITDESGAADELGAAGELWTIGEPGRAGEPGITDKPGITGESGTADKPVTPGEPGTAGDMKPVPVWLASAGIHARIGSYYERLGRPDAEGKQETGIEVYWEDLRQLWDLEDRRSWSAGMQCQIAQEMLSCLVLHTYELLKSGKTEKELKGMLKELKEFPGGAESGTDAAEAYRSLYQAAADAAKRTFAEERGNQ